MQAGKTHPIRILQVVVTLIILLLMLTACGDPAASPTPIPTSTAIDATPTLAATPTSVALSTAEPSAVVFAASSLKDVFGKMAENLGAASADRAITKVTYNFAGSQVLVTQLAQGAKADVFASADKKNMDAAVAAGSVVTGTAKPLLLNKLVVIVSQESAARVKTLKDLAASGLKIVLADPSVPAGNYSLQALDKLAADPAYGAEYKQAVLKNVVSKETNVRQVAAKVQLGEADAGIVYTTDAQAAMSSTPIEGQGSSPLRTISIPDKYNVVATYYIAPVKGADHPQAAQRFIDYAFSAEGRALLQSYGFLPPPESNN